MFAKIKNIKALGLKPCIDITVDSKDHLFCANGGIVVSNSHAVSYNFYSAMQCWLKSEYPLEFYCVALNQVDRADDKKGIDVLNQRVQHASKNGVRLLKVDINKSKVDWVIENGCLRAPLGKIKGIGKEAETIVEKQPFGSIKEFLETTNIGKGRVENLIFSGAFDSFDTRNNIYNWYHNVWIDGGGSKKKTNYIQESFFDDLDEPEVSEPVFSEKELREKEYDVNGFFIPENLLKEFEKLVGEPIEKDSKIKIKSIEEVLKDSSAFPVVLGKIISRVDFPTSKTGKKWTHFTLSDGFNNLCMMVLTSKANNSPKKLKEGNIGLFPVAFFKKEETGKFEERDRCILSDSKIDIKILKESN